MLPQVVKPYLAGSQGPEEWSRIARASEVSSCPVGSGGENRAMRGLGRGSRTRQGTMNPCHSDLTSSSVIQSLPPAASKYTPANQLS